MSYDMKDDVLRINIPGNIINEIPESYSDELLPHEKKFLEESGFNPKDWIIENYTPGLKQRIFPERKGILITGFDGYHLKLKKK